MRSAVIALLALLPVAAQEFKIPPSVEKLADKASEVVDVTLDSSMLQLASRFLSDKDPDQARAKKVVMGLKGIYVRSFEFDKTGEYDENEIAALRSQLRAPAWSRIVGVHSKKDGENADVFIGNGGEQINGLVVLVAAPKELTIVNIVGQIKPEDLRDLGGNFGIPKVEFNATRKTDGGKAKEN